MDRDRVALLLERRRKLAESVIAAARVAELAERLRGFMYPKQRAFYARSKAKQRATKKTRRSGATAGGCRELIARCVEGPGYRATYIASTRIEARARAWENDTRSGFVDVIRQYGERIDRSGLEAYDLAGVEVTIHDQDLVVSFSNGSQIDLFGADDERALGKLRGIAKHVFWIDEAQDFRFLESFFKAVIVAAMTDFGGECWLTGTPGKDCAGMFYEVTRDDGTPLQGWEVHRIAVTDNPFFGRVMWRDGQWFVLSNVVDGETEELGPFADEEAAEVAARDMRWRRTAGAAIAKNGWAEDDPDLLREWYARWVKMDARYVYAIHSVPEHQIVYAPVRLDVDGFPDLRAAMADLPGRVELRPYFTACGADLGTRAAFAFVVWAWSLRDPVLYELASWKRTGLDYDEMAAHLHAVRAQISLSLITADAGGGGKPAVMGWSKKWVDRYGLPIVEATKQNKRVAQNQLNTDIRRGLIKLREHSVLMTEWQSHRWKPIRDVDGKEVEDSTPRDASDAGLYAHRESYHHRFREASPKIVPGTPEWVTREERELEQASLEDPFQYPGAFR